MDIVCPSYLLFLEYRDELEAKELWQEAEERECLLEQELECKYYSSTKIETQNMAKCLTVLNRLAKSYKSVYFDN